MPTTKKSTVLKRKRIHILTSATRNSWTIWAAFSIYNWKWMLLMQDINEGWCASYTAVAKHVAIYKEEYGR